MTQRFDSADQRCRPVVLGLARIAVGLMWLANIHWKVPPDFGQDSGGGLYKYSEAVTRHAPFAPFAWVTEHLVLPNFGFFGWVTLLVEICLAGLLLVGYRTKIVALVGALWAIPIGLSVVYYDRSDEWSWSYILMFTANILLYAADAGAFLGVDGVLRRGADAAKRALLPLGIVTTVIGVLGLFVARSVDFVGRQAALLGSDAGFVGDDGKLVRRAELKFLWFNPLWALLTIVCGVLLIVAARQRWAARVAGIGLVAMAAVVFATLRFDYLRDDGAIQRISTGSNVAVWGGLGLAALLFDHCIRASETAPSTLDD